MRRTARTSIEADALRRRAEARLGARESPKRTGVGVPGSKADARRLVHELEVHQVELEMQNVELQEARDRMEALLEKYTDLYDFAPVGYFSLDEQGRILEANLAGAALLGPDRSRLLDRELPRFVAPPSRSGFSAFLEGVFRGRRNAVCEVSLRKTDGSVFWANLQASFAIPPDGEERRCRVAMSDLTALKQAEQAHCRIETLAVTNQELREAIVRREAVEAALKVSEKKQGRLLQQARQMQEQLRRLSHGILQAQEDERRRISRELHDDVTQILVGISVHPEALAGEATINPASLKERIARTQRRVAKSLNIFHQCARELRPTALDDLGLIATLHSLLNGLEATRQIRQATPGTRVLILSAHGDEAYVEQVRTLGAAGYLLKQTSTQILARAVREVHQGHAYYSPSIARRLQCRSTDRPDRLALLRKRGAQLSSREAEVLQLIAEGQANKQIAAELGISVKTVEKHRQHLMDKLQIHDTAGLTRYALTAGIIESSVPVRIV